MGSKVVYDMGTYAYDDDIYTENMKRGQKELAAEVLERLDGDLPALRRTKTYFVKMRKEYLAAIVSEWHTATRTEEHHREEMARNAAWLGDLGFRRRIKPEGMTRSLFPKQKRPRGVGEGRKYRRLGTKNRHKSGRGMRRLKAAQALLPKKETA